MRFFHDVNQTQSSFNHRGRIFKMIVLLPYLVVKHSPSRVVLLQNSIFYVILGA